MWPGYSQTGAMLDGQIESTVNFSCACHLVNDVIPRWDVASVVVVLSLSLLVYSYIYDKQWVSRTGGELCLTQSLWHYTVRAMT